MIKLDIEDENDNIVERIVAGERCTIGRVAESDITLKGVLVSRMHAKLEKSNDGIVITDLGSLFGTRVNGKRVREYGPLNTGDRISIGHYSIRVMDWSQADGDVNARIFSRKSQPVNRPYRIKEKSNRPRLSLHRRTVGRRHNPASSSRSSGATSSQHSIHLQWRKQIHEQLILQLDLCRKDVSRMSDDELRAETEAIVAQIVSQRTDIPPTTDRQRLMADVINEAIGLGPMEILLADETVTEIMVNNHDEVFIERSGRLQRYPLSFTSERTLMGIIERIVAPVGRRIDESSPMVDARLKDGSRVNAIIPPLALKGPSVTIRKFSKRRYDADDLIGFVSLTPAMVEFLNPTSAIHLSFLIFRSVLIF